MKHHRSISQFRLVAVQAQLRVPLQLDGGGAAAGYFRTFEVCAADLAEARRLVAAAVEDDSATVVDWGSSEVLDSETAHPPGVVWMTGRTFFRDTSES